MERCGYDLNQEVVLGHLHLARREIIETYSCFIFGYMVQEHIGATPVSIPATFPLILPWLYSDRIT